ncbi:MAG TPA: dipeptide epimerase [Syntrophorhabdaceae bacterium]|nr:dipeptide epimerase [Syntrophorhabdaceae bacterium]
MKIKSVEVFPAPLPLRKPFAIALGVMTHSPNVVVRIKTDEGVTGYGEASTWHVVYGYDQRSLVQAIKQYLTPAVIGMDPFDIEGIVKRMDSVLPKNRMAKAGVETACQDVRAKAVGLPLTRLLGGATPQAIEVLAAVDIVPVAEAESLTRLWVEKGFGCIKIKVGLNVSEDIERVRVVRETAGPAIRLRVDGNQGYDRAQAMKACKAFEAFDLQWIEQPLPDWDFDGLAELARAFSTPIAVDESITGLHDVYRVARSGAADVINIKIAKCGGISNSLKIAHAAESAGLPCFLGGCIETGVGTAAALHFAASCPNLVPEIEMPGSDVFTDDLLMEPLVVNNGTIPLPQKPGIGVDVNEDKLVMYGDLARKLWSET